MKDAASTAQREQNQRQGLIVGTLTLPFRLLGVLIGCKRSGKSSSVPIAEVTSLRR